MLIGQYTTKVSQKGRVALPKKFREQFGERALVARWYESCVVVVDIETWKRMLGGITRGQVITRPARDTDRFLLAGAFEVEFDAQGRFVLPPPLREYAHLQSDVVFIGLGDRVEVWDVSAWHNHEAEVLQQASELAQKLFEQEVKK